MLLQVRHQKFAFLLLIILLHAALLNGQNGLVAHWSFDESEGDTLFDLTGLNNHGTNYGATRVPGIIGNALSFDGENDYVRIPADGEAPPQHLRYLQQGSISLWFKATEIPFDFGIAPLFYYGSAGMCDFIDAANRGLIIELGHTPIHFGSERIYYTVWNNGCWLPSLCFDSRHDIPKNRWHHFVVVVGEDYNTGYLNGEEMHDRRYNFANSTWSQFFADALAHEKLWLGKGYWDRTTQYFEGLLDDLRIYDRPLSADEVWQLYSDTAATAIHIPQEELNKYLRIFPNTSGRQDVSIIFDNQKNDAITELAISNITGKLFYSGKLDEVTDQLKISAEKWPPGVYIAIVRLEGGAMAKKKFVIN